MINDSLVKNISNNLFIFDHDFDWMINKIDECINYMRSYLEYHDLENIEYLRITHSHEIFSKTYYKQIPLENLRKLYLFLDEIGIKGIILRDNNLSKKESFSKRILHEGHPYFLGGTAINSLKSNNRTFKKKFVCLNLLPRPNKVEVVKFLYENNIDKNTYLTHNFDVLDKSPKTLELDLKFDELYISAFAQSSYVPTYLNVNSFCNIVTETCFHEKNTIFITEKTEKCFSAAQPFILVSTCGSLKKLKELGFKTFSNWWDEGYDLVEDNEKRLKMIYSIIRKINSLTLKELQEMYIEMLPTLRHNQRINKEWFNTNVKKILS